MKDRSEEYQRALLRFAQNDGIETMECFIVLPEDITQHELILRDEEAHHATRSLRLRVGDALLASDLIGTCYQCRIASIEEDGNVLCAIDKVLPEFGEPATNILLIQGMIAQPARWEFLLEKATELGVTAIQPVATERTEQRHLRRDRSERVLRAAVKQTRRARMPQLRDMCSLEEALAAAKKDGREILLFEEQAYRVEGAVPGARTGGEDATRHAQQLALIIGPEGGLSESEIAMAHDTFGARILSLGNRRLRAETAAIAAIVRCSAGFSPVL